MASNICQKRIAFKGVAMSVYLLLTTLTDAGRKALQDDPEILKEINKETKFGISGFSPDSRT